MNHQLNFNIISEPSLLIDGITSDNINDGYYSYSWITPVTADPPKIDDFKDGYSLKNTVPYLLTLLYSSIILIGTYIYSNQFPLSHKVKKNIQCSNYSVCIIFIILNTIRYLKFGDLVVCGIPYYCTEGDNNSIDYSINYFISENTCYNIFNMGEDYSDNFRETKNEWDCNHMANGCCMVDNNCNSSIIKGLSWEDYNQYHGKMIIPLEKKDREGSNCPRITEIINYKLHTEKINNLSPYLISLFFITLVVSINCLFTKKSGSYEKGNCSDTEN
tara:strand:+ start:339 stop:1160 length:822 start_codon:yes stop_codon:yes gene_type:complete